MRFKITVLILFFLIACTGVQAAIIADHTVIDDFDNIPLSAIRAVQNNIHFLYSHTSHGSHLLMGMYRLEFENTEYGTPYIIEVSDQAEGYCSQNCVIANMNDDPPNPDAGIWEQYMRTYLNNNPDINVAMVSWGWEMSHQDEQEMQTRYFDLMEGLEQDYPDVTFIYATGRMDGNQPANDISGDLIRQYVQNNNKVLFDHNDIARHDPDGVDHPYINQDGDWAVEWCANNGGCAYCLEPIWIDAPHTPYWYFCAHEDTDATGCIDCYRKGKAMWWLLARVAGWDGTTAGVCTDGETRNCGINIGACEYGVQTCIDGNWGSCTGGTTPTTEICGNSIDENCDGTDESCNQPPIISNLFPSGEQPSTTTAVTLEVTTNEAASCKYSLTQYTLYENMEYTFATTGSTIHQSPFPNVQAGSYYSIYVRCQDTEGIANEVDEYIIFNIAEGEPTDSTYTCGTTEYAQGMCCNNIWFDPYYENCPDKYYFVDQQNPSTSDNNPGTEDLPWETMGHAMREATAGDVVLVKSGTYTEPGTGIRSTPAMNPANRGTTTNPIIFKAYPGEKINIKNTGIGPLIGGKDTSYIIWDGFIIHEGDSYLNDPDNYDTGSVVFWNCQNCELKNSEINASYVNVQNNHNAVRAEYSNNVTIRNNKIYGLWGEFIYNNAAIMQFFSEDLLVEHNEIYNCQNAVYDKDSGMRNIYRYNLIYNTTLGFLSTGNGRVARDFEIYQNIFHSIQGEDTENNVGIRLGAPVTDFSIYNNAFYNMRSGIHLGGGSGTHIYNNIIDTSAHSTAPYAIHTGTNGLASLVFSDTNVFFGHTYMNNQYTTLTAWQGQGFDTNSIEEDPLFVNPETNNFKLQSNSPAVLLGVDLQDYDNDGNTLENINAGPYITGNEVIGIEDFSVSTGAGPSICALQYDSPPCGCVRSPELIGAITGWYINSINAVELTQHIMTWRTGSGC